MTSHPPSEVDRGPRTGRLDRSLERSRAVLTEIFGAPDERPFRVEYWDGSVEPATSDGDRPVTLVLRWPGALRRMLLPPTDRSVGEAYVAKDIDFRGDLEAAVRGGWSDLREHAGPVGWFRLWRRLRSLPAERSPTDGAGDPTPFDPESRKRSHTPERDARAIRFHYDVGNRFYRLFLDRWMQYSSADFEVGEETLDEAQEAKLEGICRRLRLRPGDRLLDVGCGWGGLVRYAAERHGVEALGITLSPEQARFARRSIQEAGLGERCRIEVRDYRDLPAGERFDGIVSVGMIEHVGLTRYPEYFSRLLDLLAPGAILLNQGIVAARRGHSALDRIRLRLERRIGSFIHSYVFPDSDLVPLGRTLAEAEAVGFEVRGVRNLREHYAETLRRWIRRLEEGREEAVEFAGEATYRAWRFYMGASAHLFQSGYLGCAQAVLRRPGPGEAT